jgi:hypothetical protein
MPTRKHFQKFFVIADPSLPAQAFRTHQMPREESEC